MRFTATTRNDHPANPDQRVIEVEGTLNAAKSAAHDAFKKNFPYAEIVVHQVLASDEPVLVARRCASGTSWIRGADVTYEEPPKLRHLDDPFVQMSLRRPQPEGRQESGFAVPRPSADLKLRKDIGRDYASAARRRHV